MPLVNPTTKGYSSSHQRRGRRRTTTATPVVVVTSKDDDRRQQAVDKKGNNRHGCSSTKFLISLTMCNGLLFFLLLQLWFSYKISSSTSRTSISSTTSQLLSFFLNNNSTNDYSYDNLSSKKKISFPYKVYQDPKVQSRKEQQLFNNHRKLQQPILVVGLPKAGTSSLFVFFQCYSNFVLRGQHWYCCGPQKYPQKQGFSSSQTKELVLMADCMRYNLQQENLSILDGCGEYDVYTELNGPKRYDGILRSSLTKHYSHNNKQYPTKRLDGIFLPQRYYLKELHEWNPNSIWILNLRHVDDWINSVINIKQNKNSNDMPSLVEQFIQEMKIQNEKILPQHDNNIFGNNNDYDDTISKLRNDDNNKTVTKTFLEYFYTSHIKIVRDFCQEYNHRLIEVNITNEYAGIDLINALGWDDGKDIFDYEGNTKTNRTSRALSCWGQYNANRDHNYNNKYH